MTLSGVATKSKSQTIQKQNIVCYHAELWLGMSISPRRQPADITRASQPILIAVSMNTIMQRVRSLPMIRERYDSYTLRLPFQISHLPDSVKYRSRDGRGGRRKN